MKICMIEHNPFPETIGGGSTVIAELGKALIKKGCEVHVITSPPENSGEGDSREFIYEGIVVHRVGMPHKRFRKSPASALRRLFYELFFILKSRAIQKEQKFDAVLAQNPLLGALACRKPFMIVMHGIHNKGFVSMKGKFLGFFSKWIENYNIRRAKKVICATEEIAKHYNSGIMILNGIDFERFKPSGKIPNSIVFVGRLSKEKNPDKIVRAMDYLPNHQLYVIGFGPMGEQIKELCAKRANCRFIGKIKNENLPDYTKDKQFIAIPSAEFEAGPVTLIEGMACGCTPIITRVGWANEVITDKKNGYLLDNPEPETIAKTIRKAKPASPAILRKSIKKFDLNSVASQYLKVLSE